MTTPKVTMGFPLKTVIMSLPRQQEDSRARTSEEGPVDSFKHGKASVLNSMVVLSYTRYSVQKKPRKVHRKISYRAVAVVPWHWNKYVFLNKWVNKCPVRRFWKGFRQRNAVVSCRRQNLHDAAAVDGLLWASTEHRTLSNTISLRRWNQLLNFLTAIRHPCDRHMARWTLHNNNNNLNSLGNISTEGQKITIIIMFSVSPLNPPIHYTAHDAHVSHGNGI